MLVHEVDVHSGDFSSSALSTSRSCECLRQQSGLVQVCCYSKVYGEPSTTFFFTFTQSTFYQIKRVSSAEYALQIAQSTIYFLQTPNYYIVASGVLIHQADANPRVLLLYCCRATPLIRAKTR